MKPAVFLSSAEAEFAEAAAFYEAQSPGLGEDFIIEVERAVGGLSHNPELGTPYVEDTRRALVRRFPFNVVYLDQAEQILILAHQRRKPGYWRNRE